MYIQKLLGNSLMPYGYYQKMFLIIKEINRKIDSDDWCHCGITEQKKEVNNDTESTYSRAIFVAPKQIDNLRKLIMEQFEEANNKTEESIHTLLQVIEKLYKSF